MHIPLELKNISKNFKNNKVLNKINLQLQSQEIFGLVGLNGIGKTTLIKIILDLLNPDEGEVKMFDKNHTNLEVKKRLTYLPEKFNPSPYLKGEEFLSLSNGYYGLPFDKNEAVELAKELDLNPQALDRRISSYSKGMGQKLGLVSVFLTKAPLLILDEPMSGLDPSSRIALKNKLLQYKAQGNTVFFSSHILTDIEEICDNIAVINNGDIIFNGKSNMFIEKYPAKNLEESFLIAIRK